MGAFVEGSWEFRKDFKVGVRISGREFREFRRFDAFFGIRSLRASPYVKRLEPLSFAVGEYYHANCRMESIMETPGPHWDFRREFRGRFVGDFVGVSPGVSWEISSGVFVGVFVGAFV